MPSLDWLRRKERLQYWKTLPLLPFAWIVLAASLTLFSIELVNTELQNALQWPFLWALTYSASLGVLAALALVAIRNRKVLFVIAPAIALLISLAPKIVSSFELSKTLMGPGFEYVRWRLAMDGWLAIAAAMTGYVIFFLFMGVQGVRHVRVRTELELAAKVQQTLAPPLAFSRAGYEIHGKSEPSSQMGGDLLDAVYDGEAMACYVSDVAGHGIQAGVFMGMVKSAARTALLRPGSLDTLLADLNRVLFEVKASGSATYVTFACIQCRDGGKVEYALAGNGPILHYHASSKTMSQLAMEQFPLGLFARAKFQSSLVKVEPGDILALLTDGLTEVEDASGEQFGLERIGELLALNASGPLADLTEKLFAAVRRFGSRTDDETLVLVRASLGSSTVNRRP
jgi:serine phosphatase RsbU (regulator of sigma subunit)